MMSGDAKLLQKLTMFLQMNDTATNAAKIPVTFSAVFDSKRRISIISSVVELQLAV